MPNPHHHHLHCGLLLCLLSGDSGLFANAHVAVLAVRPLFCLMLTLRLFCQPPRRLVAPASTLPFSLKSKVCSSWNLELCASTSSCKAWYALQYCFNSDTTCNRSRSLLCATNSVATSAYLFPEVPRPLRESLLECLKCCADMLDHL